MNMAYMSTNIRAYEEWERKGGSNDSSICDLTYGADTAIILLHTGEEDQERND